MIARSRCSTLLGALLAGAFATGACRSDASTESSTADVSAPDAAINDPSTPDDFVRVPTSDADLDVDGTVAATTATTATGDEPPAGGVADPTDPAATVEGVGSTTSTTAGGRDGSSTPQSSGAPTTSVPTGAGNANPSTTAGAPTGAPPSATDQALAEAFTAQFDGDDNGLGAAFDTTCLGREVVLAFGGAAAAEEKYDITVAAVNADGELFDDIEFGEQEAEAIVAGFKRCGSLDELLLLSLEGASGDGGEGRCIVDALRDGLYEEAFAEELQGLDDGPATRELADAFDDSFDACFT